MTGLFLRLLDLTDADVLAIMAVAMGEALAVGSVAVEAVGLTIGLDRAHYWEADDAFFDLNRDKEVLGCLLAEVAGPKVARANKDEKTKAIKTIIRNHLDGADGRPRVEHWVPKWMAFPASAYTKRGGVSMVSANAQVARGGGGGGATDAGDAGDVRATGRRVGAHRLARRGKRGRSRPSPPKRCRARPRRRSRSRRDPPTDWPARERSRAGFLLPAGADERREEGRGGKWQG